jgi:hypothetical protein
VRGGWPGLTPGHDGETTGLIAEFFSAQALILTAMGPVPGSRHDDSAKRGADAAIFTPSGLRRP